jgi:hypothetical protein
MAKQQTATHKPSRSKRDTQQQADPGENQNGHEEEVAGYEQELAGLLQERIKPGLNSGAIPLLARSIAKDIAHRDPAAGASEDTEVEDEFDDEPADEADDEFTDEADDDELTDEADDDEPTDEADDEYADDEVGDDQADGLEAPAEFTADMHDLQADLGEDWILSFSVQGDDAWLTAEKDDRSQRVESPYASALAEAVELLNESGGRST